MFQKARLSLTLWYMVISMTISLFFTGIIYARFSSDIRRFNRMYIFRLRNTSPLDRPLYLPTPSETVQEITPEAIEKRMQFTLLTINGVILLIAGAAGYFLSGKTLRPIQTMVDEQDRFISDASHELRAPLTALRTELEVAGLKEDMTASEAKELIKSNIQEVENLQRLSDHLLELTQLNKKTIKNIFTKINLLDISEKAIKQVIPLAKKKHIVIDNKFEDFVLTADEELLKELLVILLDNAIKYSPPNSVMTLNSKKKDAKVTIKIRDQGIGIAQEDMPHIFDRFYRADKSRSKTETSGHGLGLSIAKRIVELHSGEISVDSALKKGTTFAVVLPIKHEKS